MSKVIEFLRDFPPTAPFVAAVDTLWETLHGNFTYLLAEPLVVLGTIFGAVTVAAGTDWKGYVAAYAAAAARWFTVPAHVE